MVEELSEPAGTRGAGSRPGLNATSRAGVPCGGAYDDPVPWLMTGTTAHGKSRSPTASQIIDV